MASAGTSASKRQERFHGAFTGGFSAGFYNSVGSAEGWTPSTFSSSRDKRVAHREQRPEDFMDEEDGLLTEQLQAKPEFDTLGSTADEVARQHAEKEAAGGAIPGPTPSELIIPVGDPMGKKLLRTMGWREGQGVGNRVRRKRKRPALPEEDDSPDEEIPEKARAALGKKARELLAKEGLTFAPKNMGVEAHSVVAKTSLHGIGYEPFKDAPEFSASLGARGSIAPTRRIYSTGDIAQQPSDAGAAGGANAGPWRRPLAAPTLGRGSHGFVVDDAEDDVYETGFGKESYDEALDADGGNTGTSESLAGTAKAWALGGEDGNEEPMLASRRYARCPSDGRLPPSGFVVAQRPDGTQRHWSPPIPPAGFNPVFKFDGDAVNSLRTPVARERNNAGLDASRRGLLLGEPPRRPINDAPTAPPVLLGQESPLLPEGSPALSFLSPAARKKLLDAANGVRVSSTDSSRTTAPTAPNSVNGRAAENQFVGLPGAGRQESAGQRNDGLQFSLANKFTSESLSVRAEEDTKPPAGGVDPSSRPAGLTLRTPATPGTSASSSSAPAGKSRGTDPGQNPVRSTFGWAPAPLLCKRLNVPVPRASWAKDWAAKDGLQIGHGSTAAAVEQGILGSLSRFVPDSSTSNRPKVPLLKGLEQGHPHGIALVSRASGLGAVVEDAAPPERPPIDLFKSIFESESESDDSDESEEGDGERIAATAGEPDFAATTTLAVGTGGVPSQGLASNVSVRRGYGSESSEENADPVQLDAEEQIRNDHSKKSKEKRGRDERHRRGERVGSIQDRCSSEAESAKGIRRSDGTSRKRSDGKRKHKHKHKKERSEKKHRKQDRKRKSSARK